MTYGIEAHIRKNSWLTYVVVIMTIVAMTAVLAVSTTSAFAAEQQDSDANSWRYLNGQLQDADDVDGAALLSESDLQSWGDDTTNVVARGIDVSQWQGYIDWGSARNSGQVDFAIIRCGWGDNESDQDDSRWSRNVSECERLGIPYGVYVYSYADSVEHAQSEADHCIRMLAGHSPSYPVYLDLEDNCISRAFGNASGYYSLIATAFCSRLAEAGYRPGVYASLSWWNSYLTDSSFGKYERWVAQWNWTCQYSKTYGMWQYSDCGSVAGISGDVDMDYLMADAQLGNGNYVSWGYPDVRNRSLWYFDSVYRATNAGLMCGYESGYFGPTDYLTRAQVAVILRRYLDPEGDAGYSASNTGNATGMSDVVPNTWYTGAANWAVQNGIINGEEGSDGNRYFNPEGIITREQLCTIVANAAKLYRNAPVDNSLDERLNALPDHQYVSYWAKDSVAWSLNVGLISGKEVNGVRYVAAQDYVQRCTMAAILSNILDGTFL